MNNNQTDKIIVEDIRMDNEAKQYFGEAARWGKFIALVVFVGLAIIFLVVALGSTTLLSKMSDINPALSSVASLGSGIIIVIMVVIMAVIGVIYYFLYKFATKIKLALATDDQQLLEEALGALKTFFIITTILSGFSLLISFFDLFK